MLLENYLIPSRCSLVEFELLSAFNSQELIILTNTETFYDSLSFYLNFIMFSYLGKNVRK